MAQIDDAVKELGELMDSMPRPKLGPVPTQNLQKAQVVALVSIAKSLEIIASKP